MSSFRDQVEAKRPKMETEAIRAAQSAQLFDEELCRAEDLIKKAVLREASVIAKGQRLNLNMFLYSQLYFEIIGCYGKNAPTISRNNVNKSLFVDVEGTYEPPRFFSREVITHHFSLTDKAEQLRLRLKERLGPDGFTFGKWGILPRYHDDGITTGRKYWIDGVCNADMSDVLPFPLTTILDNIGLRYISKPNGVDKYILCHAINMVLPFSFS